MARRRKNKLCHVEANDIKRITGMGNFKCVFSAAQENELVEHIKLMESRLFGLTRFDVRRLAYDLAQKNNLPHKFNDKERCAGEDWLSGFMQRHPDLSLRKPEATSAARAMGFNKAAVSKLLANLTVCMEKHQFPSTRIYNVDERGLTTVPNTQPKVLAQKGRRQVGTLASAERGQLVTAEICFSAAGQYIPPLLIFPRMRMKEELLDGAPPGTIAICHPSGWMQSEIFVQWLKHFIQFTKPSKEEPVLLLLDGHATHVKNLEVIDLARQRGVIILYFLPHCTHRLQPLDVSFMGPLSTFYSQEMKMWLLNHPGRVVTQFQVAKLFGLAYARSATIQNAISGFRKTGICPFNANAFGDNEFAAAETSNRAEEQELEQECRAEMTNTPQHQGPTCSSFTVSPVDVIPVPHYQRPTSTRRKGKSAIITDSPYKNELENFNSSSKGVKRKLQLASGSSEVDINCDSDTTPCLLCKEPYSATSKSDGWVKCRNCGKWAHEGCTGWEEDELDVFVCVPCLRKRK
ncbi:hypothetical protein ANN_13921 [Periplaneta americana]|uniref:Zinc finger PHD-type domain-containing protein n=1 Tax=Periplaneta americana TaxID=6978 RepID=A0ABQ8SUZ1_PERAM|nr:hypothetical protein ANN_13921 [Periplaneta americana]